MITEIGIDNLLKTFKFMDMTYTMKPDNYEKIPINAETSYVKYVSKSTMYKILESDSIFLFCSELSNDKTENKILSLNNTLDTYITCFYHNNSNSSKTLNKLNSSDVYSQWMSYCREGGAAFEFYFGQNLINYSHGHYKNSDTTLVKKIEKILKQHNIFDYSLICRNTTERSDYIKYATFPFQVKYFDEELLAEGMGESNTYISQILRIIDKHHCNIPQEYIVPYFKHSGFIQESEARLAFVDYNRQLSKCINFLDKPDGTKIPYINAKFGNLDDLDRPCNFVDTKEPDEILNNIKSKLNEIKEYKLNKRFPIIIPQGRDQEDIYNMVEKEVNKIEEEKDVKLNIICQGHLPITKITLAPTEDRSEERKKMEIYCKNKYWLRRVEICESVIPYNTQNNNH